MSCRINLLEKSECRYQGLVSLNKVVLILFLAITAISIVSFLVVSSIRLGINTKLRNVEKTWSKIKDEAAELRRKDQAGIANEKTHMKLINSRDGEQINRYVILQRIQRCFPENINLQYMFIGQETGYDSNPYFAVRLAGTSAGETGNMLPVRLKRELSEIEQIRLLGGDVVLKELESKDDEQRWSFLIEARQLLGEVK